MLTVVAVDVADAFVSVVRYEARYSSTIIVKLPNCLMVLHV